MLKTPIPFVDLRGKSPIDLLRAYPDKAHVLVASARRSYGWLSRLVSIPALPLADWRSHAWLKRTKNPYLYEIETFADVLGRGAYALNLSYEWGCTSGVYRDHDNVTLLRVLDWPFPQLGKQSMVVLQSGKGGEFYNVTWPGVAGVYTAMAPGRFSAALNQAPMRKHKLGFVGDWIKNRVLTGKANGIPPSHLLRQVFEQAPSYEDARRMLMETPLALPAIFVLAGTQSGQGCVIERLENEASVQELAAGQQVCAANHFTGALNAVGKGWRPRDGNSAGRLRQGAAIHGHDLEAQDFEWLQGPMRNPRTRLAVICDAATGRFTVQGFEGMVQATEIFSLAGEVAQTREAV